MEVFLPSNHQNLIVFNPSRNIERVTIRDGTSVSIARSTQRKTRNSCNRRRTRTKRRKRRRWWWWTRRRRGEEGGRGTGKAINLSRSNS